MRRRIGPGSAAVLIVAVVALVLARSSPGKASARGQFAVPAVDAQLTQASALDTAFFAGGCFWGVEAVFEHVKGVSSAVSGYSGGTVVSPSYEQVTSGSTGHAETVRVIFDPSQVSYGELLRVLFAVVHDPTQLNRQGPDVGPQYRSAIFFKSAEQKRAASAYIEQLTQAKTFRRPIVTQLVPLERFYEAEAYHQDFAREHPNHPYIVLHDAPKVANLRKQFAGLYRRQAD